MQTQVTKVPETQREQRSQKKRLVPLNERLSFSPKEFAQMNGKHPVWAYRQIYAGKIRVVKNLGQMLIPRSEVERVFAGAEIYNG